MPSLIIKFKQPNSQAGVSLMLSILVLSGITAIAFSLAAIIFAEIRSAGDVFRTEPALYAVQAVTEEAFYANRPGVGSLTFTTNLNGVTLTTQQRTFDDSPEIYPLFYGDTNKYLLVEPDNPYSFDNKYSAVTLNYVNADQGNDVEASLYQYQEGSIGGGEIDHRVLNIGNPVWTIDLNGYPNNAQYEIHVTNNSGDSNINAILSIESKRNISPDSGLPIIGRNSYSVSASYGGQTRRYIVNVPTGTN